MFKSCEDCKYEKDYKFKDQYQEALKQSKEHQKGYDGVDLPFYSKVYCKEFYAKPCRFEYECEWCGLTE